MRTAEEEIASAAVAYRRRVRRASVLIVAGLIAALSLTAFLPATRETHRVGLLIGAATVGASALLWFIIVPRDWFTGHRILVAALLAQTSLFVVLALSGGLAGTQFAYYLLPVLVQIFGGRFRETALLGTIAALGIVVLAITQDYGGLDQSLSLAVTRLLEMGTITAFACIAASTTGATRRELTSRTGALAGETKANVQLRERLGQELRMRQEYVSVVAHELRNPLVGIKAAATLLARTQQDAESTQRAGGIVSEASAGLKLLDDLSEVSRVESGRMQSGRLPIDLESVTRNTVAAIGLIDHPVEVRSPGASMQVLGDEQRIAQVVRNLVSNAAKYSPVDAPIEVTIGLSANQKAVIVSVRDYGIGVPPAERAQLFQKFRRLSSAGATRGSGLGLYISREIITDHGGELSADWPAGGGSIFLFSLPLMKS